MTTMADTCKICENKTLDGKIKIKGGHICQRCYTLLPQGVRNSISSFSATQLKQIKKISRKANPPDDNVWKISGHFKVGANAIYLNGTEYQVKNLRSVRLNFHPRDLGHSPNTALGMPSIVIETKDPHILIEETFQDDICEVEYIISGMNITYLFSREIDYVISCVQKAIDREIPFIPEAKRDMDREKQEQEARRRNEYARQRAEKAKQEEKRRRESERRKKQKRDETPLEAALRIYGLQQPFSLESLKQRRNLLLKTQPIHPDNGGTNERFKEFQSAYEILLKFTVG